MKRLLLVFLFMHLWNITHETEIIEIVLNPQVLKDLELINETYLWHIGDESIRREMLRRQWMTVPIDSVYWYKEFLIKEE